MTLAQFVVILAVALTTIAVALIVAAVILMEKEKQGGVVEPKTLIEFENEPATITPINRARVIEWIPVREKLPDNRRHVLVSVNYAEGVDSVCISHWNGLAWQDIATGKVFYNVVAWAELPDPYKK